MLLEQLIEKAQRKPEYDWEGYYRWHLSQLSGQEISDYTSWLCNHCLTINLTYLPARYGKCRGCGLIHLPSSGESLPVR